MYKVASSQFGYWFGNQLYYPYSIAILVSYLNKFAEIRDAFTFLPCAVDRASMYEYAEQYADADILLCSCYNWNWEISQVLMREMKRRNPNCLIIAGGPQIPSQANTIFPYISVAVHGEGERAIFKAFFGNNRTGQIITALPVDNLDDIPSPYVDGTMHKLVDPNAAKWIPTFEMVRGCPYGCAYCAWGQTSHDKVRQFGLERILSEIDWFADNKIEYIECADANFGMLPRDTAIVDYLKQKKIATGYPKTFKPSWSKKVTSRVISIAKELKSVDLLAAAGCSLQSLDPRALANVKRKSVPFDEFKSIIDQFKATGAQTFTEIIRGLPGETLDSFKRGLDQIVFESNVDTLYIYNCTVLENTELKARGYPTVRVPLYFAHASVDVQGITEYEDLILESESFTRDDLEEMYLYSWYMMAFQQMGILNWITRFVKWYCDVPYHQFFDQFEAHCKAHPDGLFGREYTIAKQFIKDGYDGKGWNHSDPTLGNVFYPIDEATWLRVTRDRNKLRREIGQFAYEQFGITDADFECDLIEFQLFTLANRHNPELVVGHFVYNWPNYFRNGKLLSSDGLVSYIWTNKIPHAVDDFDWNAQAVWYGRRRVAYKARLEDIREQT